MAVPINTDNQSLFPRCGVIIGGLNQIQSLIDGQTNDRVTELAASYTNQDNNLLNTLYTSSAAFQQTPQSWMSQLQSIAVSTFVQMADEDGTGINPVTLPNALVKIISQMQGNYHISRPTVQAAVSNHLTVGNGVLVASTIDYDGLPLDYMFAETLTATCTADGYAGGTAQPGSEPFSLLGQTSVSSIFAPNWPQGSGASTNLTTLNTSATSGLILTDGDFEQWTSNTPNNWTITVGSGTITKGVSPYTGNNDLLITGDGTTLTTFHQPIVVQPNTVYALNVYMKKTSTPSGVVSFSLTNGSGSVINNDQSSPQIMSVNVSTVTTSYAAYSLFFETPTILPSTVWLVVRLTTAITNTNTLALDAMGLQPATQAYPGGPWCALFTGNVPFAVGDNFTVATTTTATLSTFSQQLNRLLGLAAQNLKIPSAGGTLIPDSLIQTFPLHPQGFTATINGDATHIDFVLSGALPGASLYNIYRDGAVFSGSSNLTFAAIASFQDAPGSGSFAYTIAGVNSTGSIGFQSPVAAGQVVVVP